MTLRTRLALTLGLLAGATALAVAFAGYRATAGQLQQEVERSLVQYARQLADPDGRLAAELCDTDSPGTATSAAEGDDESEARPPGVVVQCLDQAGNVVLPATPRSLPVDGRERAIARTGTAVPSSRVARSGDHEVRIVTMAVQPSGAVQVARSLAENDRVLDSLVGRYLALAVAVTAGAAVAGLWLARRITRPLRGLTAAAEAITNSARLDVELEPPRAGDDETTRLARAFTTMLDALRTSREQQKHLVQDAGHELRTPLTSLRANVAVLRRHPELNEDRRTQILDDLHNELRELTMLTNELVALAADAPDEEPVQSCDLAELAQRAVERCRRRTGRTIHVDLEPSPVECRPRQLLRAADNLLANAAKFSPPDTAIEVSVAEGVLTVRDHGPGMAPADLPHLFDRFYRATTARTLPGSGLGLAIVHDTAKAHGGSASAANHPDGGAVVSLRLPRSAGTGR